MLQKTNKEKRNKTKTTPPQNKTNKKAAYQ